MFTRSRIFEQLPFFLETENSIGFSRPSGEKPFRFQDFLDVEKDRELAVISVDAKHRCLGLYDPALYFRREKGIVGIGPERYFSDLDYRTGADVSIIVSHEGFNQPKDRMKLAGTSNSRGGRVLFAIEPRFGQLYVPWVDEIRNLSSMPDIGTEIYVRSDSEAVRTDMRKQMLELGFREQTVPTPPLLDGFREALSVTKAKEALILSVALCLYMGYAAALFYHHRRYRKQIKVAYLFGGRYVLLCRYRVLPFVLMVSTGLALFAVSTVLWTGKWFISGLPGSYLGTLTICHGVLSVALYQIGFTWQYLHLRLQGGGHDEV